MSEISLLLFGLFVLTWYDFFDKVKSQLREQPLGLEKAKMTQSLLGRKMWKMMKKFMSQ